MNIIKLLLLIIIKFFIISHVGLEKKLVKKIQKCKKTEVCF